MNNGMNNNMNNNHENNVSDNHNNQTREHHDANMNNNHNMNSNMNNDMGMNTGMDNNMNNMGNNMNIGMNNNLANMNNMPNNNMNGNMYNNMNNMNHGMNNNMYNMNNNQQYGQMNDIPDNIYNMPQQQLSKPLNGKNNIIMYAVGGVILIAVIFVVIKLLSGGGYTVNCTKTYEDYGSETYKFKFDGEYFKNGKFEMDMDCSKIPGTTPEKCRTANVCSTIENSHIRDYKIVNCTSKSSGDKLYVSADIEFIFEEDKAEPQDVEKLRDYFVDGNYTCK